MHGRPSLQWPGGWREGTHSTILRHPLAARLLSVPLKDGFLFRDKSFVSPLVVLGLHADCLRLGFGLDRLLDAHVPLLVQALLRHRVGESRAIRQSPGERLRIRD